MTNIHASCVAVGGRAILITGPPGAGKSDLALRLIDRGATLVSDDQVILSIAGDQLIAAAPSTIAGKVEVRGIGIVAMAHAGSMPVALLIDLAAERVRMPFPATRDLCGVSVPVVALAPFEASAAVKVELALRDLGLRP